ncbi:MAG: hypothetical protein FJ398_17220 [Verrucomicrobia bacterium]|nr:hypothetical protein [Verrucomicrobiota bacterium]
MNFSGPGACQLHRTSTPPSPPISVPSTPSGAATIAFDLVASASQSKTIAELDRFAERAEENRTQAQAHLRTLEDSVASVQRSKSFMLELADRN